MTKLGRPIIPDSERQRAPWEMLGVSRATFYWKKRYGDLPKKFLQPKLRSEREQQEIAKIIEGYRRQGRLKSGSRS
jgi:hypothetical protein